MILDPKLNFQNHIRQAVIKARRGTGIMSYLSKYITGCSGPNTETLCATTLVLWWHHLSQIWPRVKTWLYQKVGIHPVLSSVSGDWGMAWTNTDRLCEEFGWEILHCRSWYRHLCHFYKLWNYQRLYNLHSEIPQERILRNRVAEVLKQSFQVRGELLTLFDFIEKQTLEKRCFVSWLRCQASIFHHDEIIKNSELYQNWKWYFFVSL